MKQNITRGSTMFLKAMIWLIGLIVLVLCIFVLPRGIITDEVGYRYILLGMYITAIPFYVALYQGLLLLRYIDRNNAFSLASVASLGRIKQSAATISLLYAAGMPYIYYVADKDDAPGVIIVGLAIIFASLCIMTAAAVFQRLFQNAVDIKNENDLTV